MIGWLLVRWLGGWLVVWLYGWLLVGPVRYKALRIHLSALPSAGVGHIVAMPNFLSSCLQQVLLPTKSPTDTACVLTGI